MQAPVVISPKRSGASLLMTDWGGLRTLMITPARAGRGSGSVRDTETDKCEGNITMYSKPVIVAVEKIEAKAIRRGSQMGSYNED